MEIQDPLVVLALSKMNFFYYNFGDYSMATKRARKKKTPSAPKAEKATRSERNPVDVSEIQITTEKAPPPPPITKGSKYPWHVLADKEPMVARFFIPFDSEKEAKAARSSIYSSGVGYFSARNYELVPIVRAYRDETGQWGVGAWAQLKEQEDDE